MVLRLGIGTATVVVCAAAAWALLAGSAAAQPGGVQLKVASGLLSVSAPQVSAVVGKHVTVAFTVTDARGTGAGWSLQVASARAVTVSKVAISCAAGSTCTLPSATGLAKAPSVLRARHASGMGVLRFVVTLAPLKTGPSVPVRFLVSS